MKLRIFLGLIFLAICVLAAGRLLVQTVRRPFVAAPRTLGPAPQFAARG